MPPPSLGFPTLFFVAVHDVRVAAATLVALGRAPPCSS